MNKKSRIFPPYDKPVSFIVFWTLVPGVAGGILAMAVVLLIAVINNDWDLRLAGIPILAGAVLFSVLGLLASSVCAFIMSVRSRRKGAG